MTSTPGRAGSEDRGASPAALRHWRWIETLRTLKRRFREDRLGQTAGSLTFTTLIALVPLLTVMLAVFTAFPMFSGFEAALEKYFLQNLVPDNIARPVLRALTQFTSKARGIGTAGLLVLLATALALVLTIDRTLNGIWRVRRPRPLAQRVLVYWAAITLGPLALGVSLSLTSYALSVSTGLASAPPVAVSTVLETVQFVLFAAATAGLFHYVPNTEVRWRHALAGALFVSVTFEFAKKGLAWYVAAMPTYSMVYGAFATLPILLLWIYLGWVILLLGAVIAAYAPSLDSNIRGTPSTAGWPFECALAVLRELALARGTDSRGLTLPVLSARLQFDPLALEPVIELLIQLDWIARLDEDEAARFVLICETGTTSLKPLIDAALLAPGPASEAFGKICGWGGHTVASALARP